MQVVSHKNGSRIRAPNPGLKPLSRIWAPNPGLKPLSHSGSKVNPNTLQSSSKGQSLGNKHRILLCGSKVLVNRSGKALQLSHGFLVLVWSQLGRVTLPGSLQETQPGSLQETQHGSLQETQHGRLQEILPGSLQETLPGSLQETNPGSKTSGIFLQTVVARTVGVRLQTADPGSLATLTTLARPGMGSPKGGRDPAVLSPQSSLQCTGQYSVLIPQF